MMFNAKKANFQTNEQAVDQSQMKQVPSFNKFEIQQPGFSSAAVSQKTK